MFFCVPIEALVIALPGKDEGKMNPELRNKRIRRLVRTVNERRRKQAVQIDILCNDIVSAHGEFIRKLDIISFAACFYRQILGKTDLHSLFNTAGNILECKIGDANTAFFLRKTDGFALDAPFFRPECEEPKQPCIDFGGQCFENCFTGRLVEEICRANKICNLSCLLEMGLQANPAILKKISAVTVPIGADGVCIGFILIWRSSENDFTAEQIGNITAVMPGLFEAIECYRTLSQAAEQPHR